MIYLYYFAGLKEAAGKAEEELAWESGTAADVLQWAKTSYPEFDFSAVQIAVNEEYVLEGEPVHPGDHVAFIPPVSGG
ncbi:molybdopterin converting factor subunit 1 [Domibacillus sp. DTU_2020_1001157_1_SI_ALB_TIR_016]|uniref:molybdopterin converting factor subunit 1 n=1 Tax=Domibacillus sp. DTU_2020_1001157_1_SI_ALB_TIR_016 TaxID=3077789 RepID=UPI0028EB9803|nr:molybdopterin converting factor subunit 1 [Domibacillus sp. DTU_2020_1001157_1_SI_ALB_TIR_016]WNS80490.1 molybdopterin converting factor subunit 1 [Domibacillus sp. DTU_2020_1001157_1_SI_ALB_TIR_016]